MGDLVIVSKLADLENVPYYGDLKLSSGTINPIEEKNSCVLTGYDITIQAYDYPAIRCYNSAVYKNTDGQEFYIFCPLSEPNYLMIWKTGSIFSYSRYNNVQYENVYLDTLNYGAITADGATFPYFNYSLDYRNVGGENNVKWIDSLPIFDNLQDFVDYVTAPLEPRGEATCKVTYFLPDDDYQYTKLTYKKDVQPESVNDGTIVNLDPTQDYVNVEGLIENASYWFKIFTSKSESEAFPYTVEVDPVPPEYKTYIDNINGSGFEWIKNLQSEEVSATFTDHVTLTGLNMNFSPNSRTWYTYSHLGTDLEYWNKTGFSYITSALFVSTTGIDSVNIIGSGDSYTCTISKSNSDTAVYNDGMFVYDKNMTMGSTSANGIPRKWFANFNFYQNYLYYGNCNPFYNGSWSTRTFTGTLTQVFENLQRYVRNIKIYVNDELWSNPFN